MCDTWTGKQISPIVSLIGNLYNLACLCWKISNIRSIYQLFSLMNHLVCKTCELFIQLQISVKFRRNFVFYYFINTRLLVFFIFKVKISQDLKCFLCIIMVLPHKYYLFYVPEVLINLPLKIDIFWQVFTLDIYRGIKVSVYSYRKLQIFFEIPEILTLIQEKY